MTKVRECRRVPRLIEVTKQVIGSCAGLKKRNHLSWTLHKDELRRWENVYWYWKVAHQVIRDEKVQHYLKRKGRKKTFTKMEVAVINNDRNCQWKIGVVEYHILWKKNGVKEFSICEQERQHSERAVQNLYTLELTCDREVDDVSAPLHPNASLSWPRRKG